MRIALESVGQLYALLDELRSYFNKFKINKESGLINYTPMGLVELNPDAVAGSWEVQVVLVKSDLETELGDAYPAVTEVKIQKPEYFLDILVHKKEKQLRRLLSCVPLDLVFAGVNANRLFVEYIDGNLQIKK